MATKTYFFKTSHYDATADLTWPAGATDRVVDTALQARLEAATGGAGEKVVIDLGANFAFLNLAQVFTAPQTIRYNGASLNLDTTGTVFSFLNFRENNAEKFGIFYEPSTEKLVVTSDLTNMLTFLRADRTARFDVGLRITGPTPAVNGGMLTVENPGNTAYGNCIWARTTGGPDQPGIALEHYNGGSPVRFGLTLNPDGALSFRAGAFPGSPGTQVATITQSGEVYAADYLNISDADTKENVRTAPRGKIRELVGKLYDSLLTGQPSAGLIAQELLEVAPELVRETSDGKLVVNYNGLWAYMIEDHKALEEEVEALKSDHADQLAALENRITALEAAA